MSPDELDTIAKRSGGRIAEMERLAVYASTISNKIAHKLLTLGLSDEADEKTSNTRDEADPPQDT